MYNVGVQFFPFLFPTLSLGNVILVPATVLTIFLTYRFQLRAYEAGGKVFPYYPFSYAIFLVPITEEILFRGIILSFLWQVSSQVEAIIISSLLFGVWHVKNYKYQPKAVTTQQIIYTGLILGPIFAVLTIATGNLLLAVLIHALNNYMAPTTSKYFKQ